jgi:hypothetical protein
MALILNRLYQSQKLSLALWQNSIKDIFMPTQTRNTTASRPNQTVNQFGFFPPIYGCLAGNRIVLFSQNEIVQDFKSATPVGWQKTLPTAPQGSVGFSIYEENRTSH